MSEAPDPVAELEPVDQHELVKDADWRRLDLRMLLVHPVNELVRFLPFLVGIFLLGSGEDNGQWHLLSVAVPVLIGLVRFASTRFRITAGQIELRRGLLGRSILTAPLDRVRTVELTASPIHRMLRLEKVEIGTGSAGRSGEGRLVLDSLGAEEARRLRHALLHRTPATTTETPTGGATAAETVILRFDPAWVRYAPLTTSGLVIALAALAASNQFLGNLISTALDSTSLDEQVESLPLLVAVPAGALTFLVVISVLSMIGYLLANWGFTLTHDPVARSFHVRRGALTTRQTSIDVDRLRGLELHEPLGLRLAGGGRLTAIATGLSRRAEGSAPLVPPAPRAVVAGVGEALLSEAGPLRIPLIAHGPAARRRRLVRGVVPFALVPAVFALFSLSDALPWWPVLLTLPLPLVGLALGVDRYRRLGHALTPAYLVMRWGSLRGRRDALQRVGIIGWNLRQTFLQRRAGLLSLTATTAAGGQSYEILDIEAVAAVALADEAVPGLVSQFLETPGEPGSTGRRVRSAS